MKLSYRQNKNHNTAYSAVILLNQTNDIKGVKDFL